jgi:hypothetical protein
MSTTKLPPIVRPMDPTFLKDFLSTKKFDKKLINGIVSAIGKYNTVCTKAADELLKDLKNLKEGLE